MFNAIVETLIQIVGDPYEYYESIKSLYGYDISILPTIVLYSSACLLVIITVYSIFRIIGAMFK